MFRATAATLFVVVLPRRQIRLNNTDVSYIERPASKRSAGPPLLLLHGLIASAETFAALIGALPADRRILALNLPGLPVGVEGDGPDVSLRGLATLVRDFLRALTLDRPVLLGHSHGGAIAMQFAASFPSATAGLILIAPAHPFLYRERRMVAFFNSSVGNLLARCFRFAPAFLQSVGFRRILGPAGRRQEIDDAPYRASLRDSALVGQVLRLIRTWNVDLDSLGVQMTAAPIALPTLLLWGDHDVVVPLATAGELQRHFRCSLLQTLHEIGHLPPDEAPAHCATLITNWLAAEAASKRHLTADL